LRSQLRRQNQETQRLSDETHQQRKQLADSQALQAQLNHMQAELQTVVSEKDKLRVLIEEQDARIQDLEQKLLSANSRDERAGNSDASQLHKAENDKYREKLSRLMQQKIDGLQETDDLKAEIQVTCSHMQTH